MNSDFVVPNLMEIGDFTIRGDMVESYHASFIPEEKERETILVMASGDVINLHMSVGDFEEKLLGATGLILRRWNK